jgi:hypothetical protein
MVSATEVAPVKTGRKQCVARESAAPLNFAESTTVRKKLAKEFTAA